MSALPDTNRMPSSKAFSGLRRVNQFGLMTSVLGLLCCSISANQAMADSNVDEPIVQPTIMDYPSSTGADLGKGFYLNEDQQAATYCVIGIVKNVPAQDVSLSIESSEDASSSFRETDVSASAQVSFLLGSASAKVSYIAQHSFSQSSATLTIHEKVTSNQYFVPLGTPSTEDPNQSVLELHLTRDALYLAKHNIQQFRHVCGDGYIATIVQGAELVGLVSVDATSADELSQSNFSGSASYSIASGSASLTSTLKDASSHSGFKFDFWQSGGAGVQTPTDISSLTTAAQNLPGLAVASPMPFQIVVESYTNLPNWPANTAFFETTTPLDDVMTMYWRYDSLVRYIQYIENNPTKFVSMNSPPWQTPYLYDAASAEEKDLYSQATSCYKTGVCGPVSHGPMDLYSLEILLPLPNPAVTPMEIQWQQTQAGMAQYVAQWNKTKWILIDAAAGQFDTNGGTYYNLNHYVTQNLEQAGYPGNLEKQIQGLRVAVMNQPQNELNDVVDYYIRQPAQANCHPLYQLSGGEDLDCAINSAAISQLEANRPLALARLLTNIDLDSAYSGPPRSYKVFYDPSTYSGFDPGQVSLLEQYNLVSKGTPQSTMILSEAPPSYYPPVPPVLLPYLPPLPMFHPP